MIARSNDCTSSSASSSARARALVTGPTGDGDGPDAAALDAARYQGRRLAQIAIRLLAGSRVADAAAGDGNGRSTGAAKTSQTA